MGKSQDRDRRQAKSASSTIKGNLEVLPTTASPPDIIREMADTIYGQFNLLDQVNYLHMVNYVQIIRALKQAGWPFQTIMDNYLDAVLMTMIRQRNDELKGR